MMNSALLNEQKTDVNTSSLIDHLFSSVASLKECATSKPLIWTEKLISRYDRFVTKVTVSFHACSPGGFHLVLLFRGVVEGVDCFKIIVIYLLVYLFNYGGND